MTNDENKYLDKEEQWYEDHAEDFIPAPDEVREQLIATAKATIAKTERMNIRMSKADMANLKALAHREGIPYQSLVSSVLHKYVKGLLVDIDTARKILNLS
ncbi:MAG: hypothetical protein FD137_1266 [Spirochaetes bacterium]|nr:MAG: hypothetical protein FD137_1266 [Spirochaetota bacterium]